MAGALTTMVASIFSGGVTADEYFEYTTLLLPGNGTNGAQNNTFLDSSSNNFTITRNPTAGPNAPTQGTFSPFSQTGWSGAFNTSTTYLTVTDTSNLRFGSSNFTIEAFVYRAASGATQTIASKGASTPTGWVFQISSADKLVFTDTSTSITGATSLAANTWYYVAVVRAGTGANQTTLYVNAASDATGTSATTFNQTNNMLIGADRSTANFANGYISNLRISNTNRTISSTPTSALTADANTIFLGLYNNRFQYTDSTAAFTNMSVTGTPSVQAFSPFNPTASWSAATYGGSGYFDGNGDYLTVPTTTSLSFGTGDFTIEAWIYRTGNNGGEDWTIIDGRASNSAVPWVVGMTSARIPYFYDGVQRQSSITVTAFAWTHVAFTRLSGTLKIFVNGAEGYSASSSSNLDRTAGAIIGASAGITSGLAVGYISNLRVLKGTGYSSISVPTAPLTAITNTQLLLNFTNAGIYDATSNNDLETVGNAQISTAQSKWGGSSMYFDGTGDYLRSIPTPNLELGSGDYTVECWINISAAAANGGIVGKGPIGSLTNTTWSIEFNGSANTLSVFIFNANNSTNIINGTTNVKTSTWIHVALTRSGNNTRFFINGTQEGSTYTSGYTISAGDNLYVGGGFYAPSTRTITGYIQDLRITKGYARYTANFTPPTSAFPTL